MKKITILIIIVQFSITTISQTVETKNINRIEKLENENVELKAKIEAYNQNNSSILNTVSITIGVLLGIFGLVNITQLIQTYRLNNKKFEEAKTELKKYFDEEISTKTESKISSKLSQIESFKSQLARFEIEILRMECPSTEWSFDTELSNLKKLLDLSCKYSQKNYGDYLVETALRGITNYIEAKNYVHDSDKEELYKLIKEHDLESKYEFKIKKIRELLDRAD